MRPVFSQVFPLVSILWAPPTLLFMFIASLLHFLPNLFHFLLSYPCGVSEKSGKWKRDQMTPKNMRKIVKAYYSSTSWEILWNSSDSAQGRKCSQRCILLEYSSHCNIFHPSLHVVHHDSLHPVTEGAGGSIIWRGRGISFVPSLEAFALGGAIREQFLSPFGILWSIVSTYEQD